MRKVMKTTYLATAAAMLILFSASSWAADDDGEATIRLMGAAEATLPQAVTKEITIPRDLMKASEEVQEHAVEKAAKGLTKAEERNARRQNGWSQAEKASEHNAEMSEKALEKNENRGRSDERPEPRDGPPAPP